MPVCFKRKRAGGFWRGLTCGGGRFYFAGMSNAPRQPVQPWIPPQSPRQRVVVVRESGGAAREPWRGAERGARGVNYGVLLAGLLLAVALGLGAFEKEVGAAGTAAAAVAGLAGSALALVLVAFGLTGVLICAAVMLVMGAPGRALLAVLGFFFCVGLALVMVGGAFAITDAQRRAEDAKVEPVPVVESRPAGRASAPVPGAPVMDADGSLRRLDLPPLPAESPLAEGRGEVALTNKSGVTIRARVVGLLDGVVTLVKGGREYSIGMETLDAASQAAVRRWAAGH